MMTTMAIVSQAFNDKPRNIMYATKQLIHIKNANKPVSTLFFCKDRKKNISCEERTF